MSDIPQIRIDDIRLKQILINLKGNSVKFTDSGFVEVRYRFSENNLYIKVSDSYIGIDKKNYQKIFYSFEKVDDEIT